MTMKLKDILIQSQISFGTSGARGLVTSFTERNSAAFAQSFIEVMSLSFSFKYVAIGIDNRPSSKFIAEACAGVIASMGFEVRYYGVLPTPALAYKAISEKIPAIMVTGSHIPFDRNGLKFYRPDGEISKSDEISILSCSKSLLQFCPVELNVDESAKNEYIDRYLSCFPVNALSGKRIGLYEHSSAGRDIYRRVFEALGAEVFSLDRTDYFVPIDTEAVSIEDQTKALNWSKQFNLDSIFSTDGDGDRPLISDEYGRWIRGDIVGLLTSFQLSIESLALPISCNSAVELSGFFKKTIRTKIGSPYVISEFKSLQTDYKTFAGFEANGGFILGSNVEYNGRELLALPTRDALLPGLLLLSSETPLSILINTLPNRFTSSDRITNVSNETSSAIIQSFSDNYSIFEHATGIVKNDVKMVNTTDGLRITLLNEDIFHLRPSGNSPELRVYSESSSQSKADMIASKVISSLKKFLNISGNIIK